MRHFWTVLLAVALLFSGGPYPFAAAQEEDGEALEEEVEPVEVEEEDVVPALFKPYTSSDADKMSGHPLATDCLEFAEQLEQEVGNFDDMALTDEKRKSLAKKFMEHAKASVANPSHDFEEKLYDKLVSEGGSGGTPGQMSKDGFGAQDACRFLLEHHNEL